MREESNLNQQTGPLGGLNNHFEASPEALLRSAMDALPSHIAILDQSGSIISTNTAWQRFGDANNYTDPQSGLGRNYLQICESATGQDAAEAGRVAQAIRDIINERESLFQMEYPCHSPDEKRWFMLQIARFEYAGDLRVITAHQNVSDLKQAQRAYAQSQKRLQAVVDTVVDGIFTADEHGTIETVNPAVCEMFGYEPEQIVGRSFHHLLAEPYANRYIKYLRRHRRVSSRRYAEVSHEVKGIRRNGDTFPMYIAMSRTHVGNRWLFTGIVQDITPRKRMEHEAIQREKLQVELEKEREMGELKNRFMSMISHELRTPLSVITLSSDFLRRYADRMPDAEKQETIDTIQTQVAHLENMVDDVSALSRAGADSLDVNVHTEKIDMVDFCRDIAANTQMLAADTHRIRFEGETPCPNLLGDKKLLRQALTNLINNAVKYSANGTTIHFELSHDDHNIYIRIQDEGIGIPEADQANLFEPFHRAENVGTRQGTGLGLAVTKHAIEMHDGGITFHSVEGQGTTFDITLPIVEDEFPAE